MKIIRTEKQALHYLFEFIPKGKVFIYPGHVGVDRTKYLLKLIGNPQNIPKFIHVAGTSGKGSTAYYISTLLRSFGFNVGLGVSPHLLNMRERFQVNNRLISKQEFCTYLNDIVPQIEKASNSKLGRLTYTEVTTALAYYIFFRSGVEYVVMETHLGGLFDATNAIERSNKLAVITRIGHDHTHILGRTLKEIAFQKAGIIKKHNMVVTTQQHPRVLEVIKQVSLVKNAKLYIVNGKETKIKFLMPVPQFDFSYLKKTIRNVTLRMLGSFQVQNCSLALAVVVLLSKRYKFNVSTIKVKNTLKHALFPGRMQEFKINNQTVVIDGAHNPQKMAMFTKNLTLYYPQQKFTFLLAFKKGKNYRDILRYIIPLAKKIIVTPFFNQTKFQGFANFAESPLAIVKILNRLDFKNYCICDNSENALGALLQDKETIKVITGSLYLLSEVYPKLKL